MGRSLNFSSTPSSSNPSAAEKSSSLPNSTSTNGIERTVHLARPVCAADRAPERVAVVEIVRDARAVASRGLHRRLGHRRRVSRERAEDATGVQPPRALLPEERRPVDVARLHLRRGGVPAVRAAHAAPRTESALGEVEPVAYLAPDAVVLDPPQVRESTPPCSIKSSTSRPTGLSASAVTIAVSQTEATPQPAGDVVFAAALPGVKPAGRCGCAPRPDRAAASLRRGSLRRIDIRMRT